MGTQPRPRGGQCSRVTQSTSQEGLLHAHLPQDTWLRDLLVRLLMVPKGKKKFLMLTLMD